jgi:2-polyprenyl-3-methyl-5-hydroxy-6-metoxy-1,4-benzoquinol methylase
MPNMIKSSHDFTDDGARGAWNEGAKAYDVFVESGADYFRRQVHGPALLHACGYLPGKVALDLGCGQGYFTRELVRHGAQAIGVDLAEELIACAREYEKQRPMGIEYRVLSASTIDLHWSPNSFDLITACMSIQDMSDVNAVFRGAAILLRPTGRMVISVPHPMTDTAYREWERDGGSRKLSLKVDRYFETGTSVCTWNMSRLLYTWETPYWRHTMSEWSTFFSTNGFHVRRMYEPRPNEDQIRLHPKLRECARVPYFIVFELVLAPSLI